jgi:transposase-like protein
VVLGCGRVRGLGSQSALQARHSGNFNRRDAVPRDRISMRTIRDVLRLRLEAGLSERQAARSAGVPHSTVQDDVARFRASGLP